MALRTLLILILIAASICVPIIFVTHKTIMPTDAELAELDSLVRQRAASSEVQRLSAPDRIEKIGDSKVGYFTYLISTADGKKRARAEWRIDRGEVRLISITIDDRQ